MLRYKHLFNESVVEHWNLAHNTKSDLLFEVTDEQNRAGFVAFQVRKESDEKIKCILYVKSDKREVDNIETGLAQTISENSGFFKSFKLAKSVKKEAATCGYMFSTQDPKMAEIMINYVDRKLQFKNNEFKAIKNMATISPKNHLHRKP